MEIQPKELLAKRTHHAELGKDREKRGRGQ